MSPEFKKIEVPWNKINVLDDLNGQDPHPVPKDPDEGGEVNSSLVDLTLNGKNVKIPKEFIVEPQTMFLEEDLAIYASPREIIRVHRDAPHLLRAKKQQCDGKCDECSHSSGSDEPSCQKKKT